MGAVVVKADSDREFSIIDGQQRIATLAILSLAIIAQLNMLGSDEQEKEANKERALRLRNRFIGEKDPASLTEVSKLSLNYHDNGFFQTYLIQLRTPTAPRSLLQSNRLLWECFQYFSRVIVENAELQSGLTLASLLSEVIARRLMFILITVDDEVNAYTVFETLNARGLELSTTDLLKNYLFSRMTAPNDLDALQRRWQQLIATVQQERFGEFLRYHYLTAHRQIRSGRLFTLIRNEIKDASQVFSLVDVLEGRAPLFTALSDPNNLYWLDVPAAKPYIDELALFRVRQMIPLLFAVREKFSDTDFIRVLKIVTAVSFRYTVISGLNPSDLESVYSDAAQAVLNGSAATPAQVFEKLSSIYVSDAQFKATFATFSVETRGQRKNVAKYILAKLESDVSQRSVDFRTDPGSIEHILPENPTEDWTQYIPAQYWDEAIYRLGNLTLLELPLNREVGNAIYDAKKTVYERSNYTITKTIPVFAPAEWSINHLQERQERMALRAIHIWRSDFAV